MDSVEGNDMVEYNCTVVPNIPVGISGTALAASLLRDGWSLAKMYAKYQEAVDALRHEQLGRKQSQAILERVLYEIEEKAGVILDERGFVFQGFNNLRAKAADLGLLHHWFNCIVVAYAAEHDRLLEAYSVVNQKLQHSLSEKTSLERTIQEYKADLRRHDRDYSIAQKEIVDLQKQVTILLKECRDVQLRCGSVDHNYINDSPNYSVVELNADSDAEKVISERLLTFKDINRLVEQNVQLRGLVRSLSDQIGNRDTELKEKFEIELQKHTDEATAKVNAVLTRAEEQGRMIESLHTSVAMYKKLYEEEHKLHSSHPRTVEAPPGLRASRLAVPLTTLTSIELRVSAVFEFLSPWTSPIHLLIVEFLCFLVYFLVSASGIHSSVVADDGRKDFMFLLEGSQQATKRAHEEAAERVRCAEEDLEKLRHREVPLGFTSDVSSQKLSDLQGFEITGVRSYKDTRSEVISLRSERDKLALEANFASEKLDRFMKDYEHQRNETNAVISRNVEFSQLIIDHQRKLRESSESLHVAEELSRKLTMEVSVLKHEKEMLLNAEKRACDEVHSLSGRVHRLQASLDTIQSAEEVREDARRAERRKQEEYTKQIEKEWAEAKKELQEQRDMVRRLSLDREESLKNAMRQVEEMGKELANALRAVASAEARAAVSEARYSEVEKKIKSPETMVDRNDDQCGIPSSSTNDAIADLCNAREEIEKLREEAQVNKEHMLQYKSIAQVNEAALNQMEFAHENFKIEADKVRMSLEAELLSVRERINELESECSLKSKEVASSAAERGAAIASSLSEIDRLKQESSVNMSQITSMEIKICCLKEDLEKEHQRWQDARTNYERQVILQSETIQELTKTSQALASLQEEASELRKLADALKTENNSIGLGTDPIRFGWPRRYVYRVRLAHMLTTKGSIGSVADSPGVDWVN
ncbi:nuclear pore anchor [Actinidia rufa]|uniref:Nuclear pore anchor n=1 Tax=Actinidia rufa TaxID=165716 RepID=A0A7J0DLJ0_9ERIC|nr:nuclear pore anchor [Actinidia rufa]